MALGSVVTYLYSVPLPTIQIISSLSPSSLRDEIALRPGDDALVRPGDSCRPGTIVVGLSSLTVGLPYRGEVHRDGLPLVAISSPHRKSVKGRPD